MIGNLQRSEDKLGRSIASWWSALLARPVAGAGEKRPVLKERLFSNLPWTVSLGVNAILAVALSLYTFPRAGEDMHNVMEATVESFVAAPKEPLPPEGGGVDAALAAIPSFAVPAPAAVPASVITVEAPKALAFNVPQMAPSAMPGLHTAGDARVAQQPARTTGTGTGAGAATGSGTGRAKRWAPRRTGPYLDGLLMMETEDEDLEAVQSGKMNTQRTHAEGKPKYDWTQIGFGEYGPWWGGDFIFAYAESGGKQAFAQLRHELEWLSTSNTYRTGTKEFAVNECIIWSTSLKTEPDPADIESMKALMKEHKINFHIVVTSGREPSAALMALVQETGGTCQRFDPAGVRVPKNPKVFVQ